MRIEKYSFGTGDRFGREGRAQLSAIQEINLSGTQVVPVWNKSNREHTIIGSEPADVKAAASSAVSSVAYAGSYYVDADHINIGNVDRFADSSDFFTIDVADCIGRKAERIMVEDFVSRYIRFAGRLPVKGIDGSLNVTGDFLNRLAENYLVALHEVKKIFDHIVAIKGPGNFITEVSVDEAELVQQPLDLLFILAELKYLGIEVQTIAPKFSGLFAKGVDYFGDIKGFAMEFEQDIAVIRYAVENFGLPGNLKISVHSGSDKFSIYPAIRSAMLKFDAGIHIKTAGTTWLEEVIGLAEAGGEGLEIARDIYAGSMDRYDELTGPYATVLKIDRQFLPPVSEVNSWSSRQFTAALTHDTSCRNYNPHFRQLIHVGYKIAAEMGSTFTAALDKHHDIIAAKVKYNLLERHLKPLFNNWP